jgi:uncharacterized protein (DUF4415 family)
MYIQWARSRLLTRRANPSDLRALGDAGRAPAASKEKGLMARARRIDFSRGRRGSVLPPAKGKTRITIRLDTDLLDWFRREVDRAGGGNYQTLINEALRQHVENKRENLEDTLRRVLREELARLRVPRG